MGPMNPDTRRRAALALALSAPATTLGSLCAYVFLPGAVGQAIYMALRLWIAVFPILWTLRVEHGKLGTSPLPAEKRREAWLGALGLSALVLAVVGGSWVLFGERLLDATALRESVEASGLTTPLRFVLAGLAISFGNSLLEEYFWRWFVGRQCDALVGERGSPWLSALLFTSHHVVTFCVLFGGAAGLVASVGVFAAGLVWSFALQRWRSIWPGWWVHVVADLAGLALGASVLCGSTH
jgi:membrane protease YdiL (CAAX protease family)